MSEQRRQILEMIAEGKMSPEDAERLLEKETLTGDEVHKIKEMKIGTIYLDKNAPILFIMGKLFDSNTELVDFIFLLYFMDFIDFQ